MTQTLNQLLDTILEELSSFKVTDDFPIDPDYIKDKIVAINGSLVREEYGQTSKVNFQFYQRFDCNHVECMETVCEVGGILVTKKHPIYRVVLPVLMPGIGNKDIIYFGLSGYKKNFRRTTINGFASTEYNLYTGKKPAWCPVGNEAFVTNLPTAGTRLVSVIVVLADPRKAPNWSDETSIFPTPSPYKLAMLVKADIAKSFNLVPDLKHDAQRALGIPKETPQNAEQPTG